MEFIDSPAPTVGDGRSAVENPAAEAFDAPAQTRAALVEAVVSTMHGYPIRHAPGIFTHISRLEAQALAENVVDALDGRPHKFPVDPV